MNAIPTQSGGIEKMRLPTTKAAAIDGLTLKANLFNFQTAKGIRQLLCCAGQKLYRFALDAYTPTLIEDDPDNDAVMSVVQSNNIAFVANGIRMQKWTGTDWQKWGIASATSYSWDPTFSMESGALTMDTGRKYRFAHGNSVTGHVGRASDISDSTGPLDAECVKVTVPNSDDPQVDRIFLFGTMNGGADCFWLVNPDTDDGGFELDAGTETVITDNYLDEPGEDDPAESLYLNLSVVAPLYNYPPLVGKYLARYQGRIFVANLVGDKQGIIYSGYERILIGRPEESFPQRNRLRLAVGADEISGIGALQSGIVAFSKSNEMFMLRGSPEDNVSGADVQFAAVLEQLPYSEGCSSHWSIAETPYGLCWLGADKTIKVWNGSGPPISLSGMIYPLLRSISYADNARGFYWNWLEKEWYVLACSVGSTYLNRLIVCDLDQDQSVNVGAFVLGVGDLEAITVVEDVNGLRHIIFLQNGALKELTVQSVTVNAISQAS